METRLRRLFQAKEDRGLKDRMDGHKNMRGPSHRRHRTIQAVTDVSSVESGHQEDQAFIKWR